MAVQSIVWRPSRRTLLAATASSVAAPAIPLPATAETAADGFLLLRARPAARGPALRVKRGDEVRLRLINDMTEPAAIHWRGVRIANAMDGVPGLTQAAVPPGASFDYRFRAPDAGTFWYHPPLAADGRQLRGPYGSLQVDEPAAVAADRDLLLLVDGGSTASPAERIVLRRNERLRLRLINATAAILRLRLERLGAWVLAIDGQPAEPFAARDGRVVLGPANRIDLFIDATLGAGEAGAVIAEGERGDAALLQLQHSNDPPNRAAPMPVPRPLPSNGLPERMDFGGALRAEIAIGNDPDVRKAPLFTVRRGRTVVLAFANRTAAGRVVHVHGHSFRLLDQLDDGWKPFWLDTTLVPPSQTQRIAFVADNPGQWLIEAEPSVGWFVVT